MGQCNYCRLKSIKYDAAKKGSKVVLRSSNFMGGTDVFVLPKGTTLPPYKEPSDKLPNGDEVYRKYHQVWLMEISNRCCC